MAVFNWLGGNLFSIFIIMSKDMMWLGNDLLKSTNLKRSWWDVAECWMISQTGWNPPNLQQQWKCSLSPIQLLSLHSSPILKLQTQSQSRGIYFVQIYWAPFSNLSAPALFFLPKCAPQKIRPEFPIEEDLLYNSQHVFHSFQFFCLFISKILHSYYIHWLSMCIFTKKFRTFDPNLPIV